MPGTKSNMFMFPLLFYFLPFTLDIICIKIRSKSYVLLGTLKDNEEIAGIKLIS